jgi:hypothetical protein
MKEKEHKYITKSALRDRGWTQKIINELLKSPDLIKPNPMYRKASPMQLYEITKIEAIELSQSFKDMISKSVKHKNSAKKAVKTKTNTYNLILQLLVLLKENVLL